ncbi:ATP-dependent helicase [Dysosmobacter sp.]|uniref:ATP-dependent helicase n=1 Tax=Dysosmobacter sp. TaxID=2591382 RepID=UPI00307BEA34
MTRSEFDRKYTSQLNPQQLAAVHAVGGAVLLLAVPGSGKTTVLVTRLGYMLCCCGISPDAILTMTYTKAATKEMQKRFVRLFGQDCPQIPEIRTINGVSSKIIDFYTRTHGSGSAFTVVENEGELAKIVSDLYRELSGEFATQSVIKELRKGIAYVKNMMLGKEDLGELDTGFDQFPELYVQYNLALRQRRWMDYDDQMIYAKTILENYPDILAHFQDAFPYICVDEAQDTSKIQHAIIQLLARKTGNLFMVGDEDQSIYGFRAAYPDALMQFEQTYPKARVLLMEENYRSTPEILHLANGFIRKNTDRRPKTVRPTRASGANVHLISAADRTAQYAWLLDMAAHCDGRTAVLYRNNDSALPLIDLMERQGLPFRCRQMDDTFFTHRLVADLLDIIAFANDRKNTEAFLRIYYKIGCGITKKAAEYACEACQRSGKTVLEELLTFSPPSQYARDSAAGLMDLLPQLLEETAARGLKWIWTELRYKDYVEQQQLDGNKFEILTLLAEREADLNTLVARLDYLRMLVSAPPEPSSEGLILSTVHSSKGLEYETVYLLDVLDGILPAVTEPKGPEEERRYQEERRLFYVAMTRAKDHLYLFSCLDRSSAFIRELRRELPVEKTEEDDLFAALREELCGKAYYHRQKGRGTVRAACEGRCMIAYPGGETETLTVGQMYDRRRVLRAAPSRTAVQGKPRIAIPPAGRTAPQRDRSLTSGETTALMAGAVRGRKVIHTTFGTGTIVSCQGAVMTVQFPQSGEKKFVLPDAVRRGLLRYDGDDSV